MVVIASIRPNIDLYNGIAEACDRYEVNFGVLISVIGSQKRIDFDGGDITYESPCALIGAQDYVGKTDSDELVTHVHC